MRVLITAGGTSERIDDVRAITNFSTGRLGSLVAEAYSQIPDVDVTLISAKGSLRPTNPAIRVIEIESVQELLSEVTNQLEKNTFEIVVHSMAVSDYYLVGTTSQETLVDQLKRSQSVEEGLNQAFEPISSQPKKLSSQTETMYFQLKQTPKVISLIKQLQPKTSLVGFKLLVDISEKQLVQVAKELMAKNDCDFVLANDKTKISGDQHLGHLINRQGEFTTYASKQAIAQGIIEQTMKGRTT